MRVWNPRVTAFSWQARKATVLFPIKTFCTVEALSSGHRLLVRTFLTSSDTSFHRPNFCKTPAAAFCDIFSIGDDTLGAPPIKCSGSPTISDKIIPAHWTDGSTWRSRPPFFTADNAPRTVLRSWMGAPAFMRLVVMWIFSASVTGAMGSTRRDEAPPEMAQSKRRVDEFPVEIWRCVACSPGICHRPGYFFHRWIFEYQACKPWRKSTP